MKAKYLWLVTTKSAISHHQIPRFAIVAETEMQAKEAGERVIGESVTVTKMTVYSKECVQLVF